MTNAHPKTKDLIFISHLVGSVLTLIASLLIFIHILVKNNQSGDVIGLIFFFTFFILGLFGSFSSSLLLAILPLLPNFDQQLQIFWPSLSVHNEFIAFKSIAGLFIGTSIHAFYKRQSIKHYYMPWPITISLSVITLSTMVAISHNLWQSGTAFSIYGVFFNLLNFPLSGWHDDYRPLTDWLAYILSGAFISVLIYNLKLETEPDRFIFRPLIFGLIISAFWGLFQVMTGLGLDPSRTGGGRPGVDSGVYGFSTDIHSYAGLMLLGALGFWGYLSTFKDIKNRAGIYILISISWLALWLSKSRASILIAIFIASIYIFKLILKNKSNYRFIIILSVFFSIVCVYLFFQWKYIWVSNLVYMLVSLKTMDYETINRILAYRPEFFQAALNMLYEFPFLGVGLGNVYRLSINKELTTSSFLEEVGGENTHNYFLQTLAELGIVGTAVITFSLLFPLVVISKRSLVWPAYCAFGALCLGNIYAHSFLIRENLMIGAAFIALAYGWVERAPKIDKPMIPFLGKCSVIYLVSFLFLIAVVVSSIETYRSFYRQPFHFGSRCYIERSITADNWTTGLLSLTLPMDKRGVRIHFNDIQPDVGIRPVFGSITMISSTGELIAQQNTTWTKAGPNAIEVKMDSNQAAETNIINNPIKIKLKISRCFIPSNLGISTDKRILGVQIDRVEFF